VSNKEGEYDDDYDGSHVEIQTGLVLEQNDANQARERGHHNLSQEENEVAHTVNGGHLQDIRGHGIPSLERNKNL